MVWGYNSLVIRSFVPMLAILALLVQVFTNIWPGALPGQVAPFEHVKLHAQSADHHHHEDQSVHVEDADSSAQHSHAGEGAFNCIVAESTPAVVDAAPSAWAVRNDAPNPRLAPNGLFRPPRHA